MRSATPNSKKRKKRASVHPRVSMMSPEKEFLVRRAESGDKGCEFSNLKIPSAAAVVAARRQAVGHHHLRDGRRCCERGAEILMAKVRSNKHLSLPGSSPRPTARSKH
jgi:hypothetical protein